MIMRRMSFAGALAAIAIGAVLAFAVHASPKDFDLQEAGVIIMLGGVADVLVRLAIPGGPLMSAPVADVAAGAEAGGYPAQASAPDYERAEGEGPVVAATNPVVTDPAQVPDTPEAPQAVRTVMGRPVRPRGRWSGRGI
jgi:hypothetical protein